MQPLESPEAVNLLKNIILATKGADQDEGVDYENIVSKAGGISLATKVVGRVLKSKALYQVRKSLKSSLPILCIH